MLLKAIINQLNISKALIESLSNEVFNSKINSHSSTVGAHFRHILEFIEIFLFDVESSTIDYDNRKRNELIETNRDEAISLIKKLIKTLNNIPANNKDLTILETISQANNAFTKVKVSSTFERELLFLASHTIHHLGIIKILCEINGIKTNEDFGKAASTISYERKVA